MDNKESHASHQPYNKLPQPLKVFEDQGTFSAPPTLLARLEAQIAQHQSALAIPLSVEHIQQALKNEHWEVRSSAIERLSTQNSDEVYALLEQAFHDEHRFVRMSALHVLSTKEDTSIGRSMLTRGAHDNDWQVREVAIQVLGSLGTPACLELVKSARDDENAEVRDTAQLILRQYKEHQSSNLSSLPPRKKRARHTTIFMLVATLVLVIGVLTAAGYSWWNYQLGDPSLYTPINQQQTNHGVTIKVIKAYADIGHTIIAFSIPAINGNTFYYPVESKLTGSVPQFQDAQTSKVSIQYGAGKNNPGYSYLVQPQFLVPTNSKQLTIHLAITQLAATLPSDAQGVQKVSQLQGNWNFTFTIPFHHTNDTHIPSSFE